MSMTIKSNHHWRDVIRFDELTDKERKEFDYLHGDEFDALFCSFIRYKGQVYDLGEFIRTPQDEPARQELNQLSEWHGYQSDSYFSGVVVRYSEDCEQVQMGTYYC